MSAERSASSSAMLSEYSLRLELGTEQQKRQLAEERLRQFQDRLAVEQSSSALLTRVLAERSQLEGECDEMQSKLVEARNDNIVLAEKIQSTQAELAHAHATLAAVSHERDDLRRDLMILKAEMMQVRKNQERLEEQLVADAKHASELETGIVEKDRALTHLQQCFRDLADKTRTVTSSLESKTAQCAHLEGQLSEHKSLLWEAVFHRETALVGHQETVRRLSLLLMEEEQRGSWTLDAWRMCATGLIPRLEGHVADTEECAASLHANLSVLLETEQARAASLVSACVNTVDDWAGVEAAELKASAAAEAARSAEVLLLEARREVSRLSGLLREQNSEFARLAQSRQAPPLPSSSSPLRMRDSQDTVAKNAASSLGEQSPSELAATLDALYLRGEGLVLRQRVSELLSRMEAQAAVCQAVEQQNESLRSELVALHDENRMLTSLAASYREHHSPAPAAARHTAETLEESSHVIPESVTALHYELDACRSRLATALSDGESYQRSIRALEACIKAMERDRVPLAVHEQELQCVQSEMFALEKRLSSCEKHLVTERQRRQEAEVLVAELKGGEQMRELEERCIDLQRQNDALAQSYEDTITKNAAEADNLLTQRDELLAEAARKLLAASTEIDELENERSFLLKECETLRERLDAALSLRAQVAAHGSRSPALSTPHHQLR